MGSASLEIRFNKPSAAAFSSTCISRPYLEWSATLQNAPAPSVTQTAIFCGLCIRQIRDGASHSIRGHAFHCRSVGGLLSTMGIRILSA